jgi:hypothetical protein
VCPFLKGIAEKSVTFLGFEDNIERKTANSAESSNIAERAGISSLDGKGFEILLCIYFLKTRKQRNVRKMEDGRLWRERVKIGCHPNLTIR